MHSLRGRDFLSIGDLTPAELTQILSTAHAQKRSWAREERSTPLEGKSIALIFQKPSMRTRVSFELACTRLGAHPVVMSGGRQRLLALRDASTTPRRSSSATATRS